MSDLPKGFVLDQPPALPEGFVVDPRPPKMPDTGAVPFVEGALRGARDVVDQGAAMLVRGVEAVAPYSRGDPRAKAAAVDQARGWREDVDQINAASQQDYAQNWMGGQPPPMSAKVGRVVGNVAATLPVAMQVPGAAGPLAARLASGTVAGGLAGALQPVDPAAGNFWSQTGENAKSGAIGGAIGTAAMYPFAKFLERPRSALTNVVAGGVNPTPGQMSGGMAGRIESKLESWPLIGDAITNAKQKAIKEFNVATVNKALEPLGVKLPKGMEAGREAVEYAAGEVSKAYQNVVPKLTLNGADSHFKKDLADTAARAVFPQARAQLDDLMMAEARPLMTNQKLDGQAVDALIKRLGEISRSYKGGDAVQREVGSMVEGVREAFLDLLGRQNMAVAKEFKAARTAAAQLMRVENAAGRLGQAEAGVFSPAQLVAATRAMDPSSRGRQFSHGNALMQEWAEQAKSVLGPNVPNSGTTDRAFLPFLATNPAAALGTIAAAPLASIPYSFPVRQLAAKAVAKRNPATDAVSQGLSLLGGPAGAVIYPGLLGSR